jgi:hypothetical protein
MIPVPSFKDHIRTELGLDAGIERDSWEIRGDGLLKFRLKQLLDEDRVAGESGDAIFLQFDGALPDALCVARTRI